MHGCRSASARGVDAAGGDGACASTHLQKQLDALYLPMSGLLSAYPCASGNTRLTLAQQAAATREWTLQLAQPSARAAAPISNTTRVLLLVSGCQGAARGAAEEG